MNFLCAQNKKRREKTRAKTRHEPNLMHWPFLLSISKLSLVNINFKRIMLVARRCERKRSSNCVQLRHENCTENFVRRRNVNRYVGHVFQPFNHIHRNYKFIQWFHRIFHKRSELPFMYTTCLSYRHELLHTTKTRARSKTCCDAFFNLQIKF